MAYAFGIRYTKGVRHLFVYEIKNCQFLAGPKVVFNTVGHNIELADYLRDCLQASAQDWVQIIYVLHTILLSCIHSACQTSYTSKSFINYPQITKIYAEVNGECYLKRKQERLPEILDTY